MTKQRYYPDRVTRKQFDYYCDRTTDKVARFRQNQIELDRRLRLVEEFLTLSPHASAWKIFLESKK